MSKTQKNKAIFFAAGLAAVVLALSLVLAGCPVDSGQTVATRSITLSGQVYTLDLDTGEYVNFHGNRRVSTLVLMDDRIADIGGQGNIDGGQLHFTIGTPRYMVGVETLFEGYEYMYRDFKIYPPDAMGVMLLGLVTTSDGYDGWLDRSNLEVDGNVSTLDEVYYIYVDRDTTITGRGMTIVYQSDYGTWQTMTINININLRTGWNVMHVSQTTTITEIGGLVVGSETVMLSANDPEWARWKLFEIEDNISGTRMSPSIRRPGMPFRQFTTPGRQRFAPLPY